MIKSSILISKEEIAKRVAELGSEVSQAFSSAGIEDFLLLWIAEGGIMFASDLSRAVSVPHKIMSIHASSFGNEQISQGKAKLSGDLSKANGQHLLIVDDIHDTGNTLNCVYEVLEEIKPLSVRSCFLLNKKIPDAKKSEADFIGFDIENLFVFGYGLDLAGNLRHLPEIHVKS